MNAWFTKLLDLTALPGNADQICERLHQLTQEGALRISVISSLRAK